MITKRQHELLVYLYGYQLSHGYAPLVSEMAVAMGVKSQGNMTPMLDRLQELGFIRREPRRARALKVLRLSGAARRELGLTDKPAQLSAHGDAES